LVKLNGDAQTASAGQGVATPPTVRVTDAYGNGIQDVEVTFAILSGHGVIETPVATSDSAGIATVGGWRLDDAGHHRLSATSHGTNPVFFDATAFSPQLLCGQHNELPERAVLEGELSSISCEDAGGRFFDSVSATPGSSGLYRFSLTSADFDTDLEVRDASGAVIADNDNRGAGTSNSEVLALLPGAPLTLIASAAQSGDMGKYRMSFEAAAAGTGCDTRFTARGIEIDLELVAKPCDTREEQYGDRYRIFLKAGSALTIKVTDLSYSGWFINLYDSDNGAVAAGVVTGPYETVLQFDAIADGYYTIRIRSGDENGSYRLSIH
jgi:hypothetical protein